MSTKKLQIVGGMNADTLDGQHASEFASAVDVSDLQTKVGDMSVSEQISNAIADKQQTPLIGSIDPSASDYVTPVQVIEAVNTGRDIIITVPSVSMNGQVVAQNIRMTTVTTAMDAAVVLSMVWEGMSLELYGDIGNGWSEPSCSLIDIPLIGSMDTTASNYIRPSDVIEAINMGRNVVLQDIPFLFGITLTCNTFVVTGDNTQVVGAFTVNGATFSIVGVYDSNTNAWQEPIITEYVTEGALNAKVDKEDGKGLSSNDYTDMDRSIVENISGINFNNYVTFDAIGSGSITITGDRPDDSVMGYSPYFGSFGLNDFADCFITIGNVTEVTDGLMPFEDKVKLDTIEEGATNTIIDSELSNTSTNPVQNKVINTEITSLKTLVGDTSVSEQITAGIVNKVDKIEGMGLSTNDYTTNDKNKLSGIATGAEVNQNAFSNITIGDTTLFADAKTDTLTFEAGSNVVLTPDVDNDKITIDVGAISNDLIDIICAD